MNMLASLPTWTGPAIDGALILLVGSLLFSGRVSPPRAFGVFALLVVVLGRVDFREALTAIGSPAIWAVVSLVVFSIALGKLPFLRQMFFGRSPRGIRATLARLLGSAALTSSVVPNTAVVAAMLGPASRRPNVTAHQLLLPLSYMSLAAGMMTPFGTSASLMVVGQAARSGVHLDVMDFVLPGVMVTLGVFATLLIASPIVLRERRQPRDAQREVFQIEARVEPGSKLVGKTVVENRLRQLHSFYLAEIVRGERVIAPVHPRDLIEEGDRLILVGDVQHIDEIQNLPGVKIIRDGEGYRHATVYRAVISASSFLVGRTLREVEFRARFDASVLGIRRASEPLSGKLGNARLQSGDLLLLAAGPDFGVGDDTRANLYILESDDSGMGQLSRRDSVLLVGAFLVFLCTALFQWAPIAVAALLLAGTAVLMDWVAPREVRRGFPFDLVIVLWGSVLLSMLVQQSGLSGVIAAFVGETTESLPAWAAVAAVFAMAWLMTEFFSNTSAALIALPVALDTASVTGHAPEAFALAAAFGASASFLMPFGYQTHLMVLNPGRYRATDFIRLGVVVLAVYAGLALTGLWWFQL